MRVGYVSRFGVMAGRHRFHGMPGATLGATHAFSMICAMLGARRGRSDRARHGDVRERASEDLAEEHQPDDEAAVGRSDHAVKLADDGPLGNGAVRAWIAAAALRAEAHCPPPARCGGTLLPFHRYDVHLEHPIAGGVLDPVRGAVRCEYVVSGFDGECLAVDLHLAPAFDHVIELVERAFHGVAGTVGMNAFAGAGRNRIEEQQGRARSRAGAEEFLEADDAFAPMERWVRSYRIGVAVFLVATGRLDADRFDRGRCIAAHWPSTL